MFGGVLFDAFHGLHKMIFHLKRPGTLFGAEVVSLRFCNQTNTAHTCNFNLKPSNLWFRLGLAFGTLRLGLGQGLQMHSNETHNESIVDLKILVTGFSVLAFCIQTKTQDYSLIRYFHKPFLVRVQLRWNRWNYQPRRWNCWNSLRPHWNFLTFWKSSAPTHEYPHTCLRTIRRL